MCPSSQFPSAICHSKTFFTSIRSFIIPAVGHQCVDDNDKWIIIIINLITACTSLNLPSIRTAGSNTSRDIFVCTRFFFVVHYCGGRRLSKGWPPPQTEKSTFCTRTSVLKGFRYKTVAYISGVFKISKRSVRITYLYSRTRDLPSIKQLKAN